MPTQARARTLDRNDMRLDASIPSDTSLHGFDGLSNPNPGDHVRHDGGLMAYQDLTSYDAGGGFDDFQFPDFLRRS